MILGVGIDYALFVVTRHRHHLHEGMSIADAAGRASGTAGQSVLFAGTTVLIALAGLILAGIPSITTMGAAVAIVVVAAMAMAVTMLPPFSAWRDQDRPAVGAPPPPVRRRRPLDRVGPLGRPRRAPTLAVRRRQPGRSGGPGRARHPAAHGWADDGNAAASTTHRKSYDLLSSAFGEGFNGPLSVVVDTAGGDVRSAVERARAALASDAGIASVTPPRLSASGDTAVILATPTSSPQDVATSELVERHRAEVLPGAMAGTGSEALITGQTAFFEDISRKLTERLAILIAAVVALSFLLLMIVFRSVLVPLKAALMNLLSIGAAYGVVVAVFQWGWGAKAWWGWRTPFRSTRSSP